MSKRILVTRVIPDAGLDLLRAGDWEVVVPETDQAMPREQLLRLVRGCVGLLPQLRDTIDAEVLDAAGSQLRVVSNFAVGYNNIDVQAASHRGVAVCNTPGVLTEATADTAWLLLMAAARRAAEGDAMVRSGVPWEWTPKLLVGADLYRKTIAIVGAGRIGFAVGRRAKGWDMRVVYVARSRHADFEQQLGAERMELEEALAAADFVSLHVPLTDQTRHLINADRLRRMKPTAFLINTARGPVVDEKALVQALREGWIAGAGLDVYEDEPRTTPGLVECRNTFLLPHIGSATRETRDAMARLAARNLLSVLEGKECANVINRQFLTPAPKI